MTIIGYRPLYFQKVSKKRYFCLFLHIKTNPKCQDLLLLYIYITLPPYICHTPLLTTIINGASSTTTPCPPSHHHLHLHPRHKPPIMQHKRPRLHSFSVPRVKPMLTFQTQNTSLMGWNSPPNASRWPDATKLPFELSRGPVICPHWVWKTNCAKPNLYCSG